MNENKDRRRNCLEISKGKPKKKKEQHKDSGHAVGRKNFKEENIE